MPNDELDLDGRLLADIVTDIRKVLTAEALLDDSFGLAPLIVINSVMCRTRKWPDRYQWVACFAVRGGSEGHYVHVEIITPPERGLCDGPRELIFLGKTFEGFDHAWAIAKRVAQLMGA